MTGLVAQQQCVGPLHTPLADVAVTAASYFSKVRENGQVHIRRSCSFHLMDLVELYISILLLL